ncbi:MAG TPA: dihydrofolate reductase family protein [Frankiaceae bacterium]|jgi:dihydrofolate reductase|nr:dihydrofolate reductase family protein [Frankiaceae bacterium]
MSRITVQTHVTLDGVIESPPEALLPYMSDEGRQATLEVAALREQLDLLSYGCGALARDLLRDRLLDELHLNMTPVVAGRGRRLFDEPSELLAFDLADSRTYPTGAVRLVIRPGRAQDG